MFENSVGNIKVSIPELCYYLFFSVMFFAKGIGLYDGQSIYKVLFLLAAGLWGLKIVLTRYSFRELLGIGILILIGGIVYLNTREKGVLLCVMTVTGLKRIPMKRIFGVACVCWCISFLPTVILTTLGVIDSPFRVHVRPVVGFVIRWGLGAAHPNVGHISYLIFTILVVYVLDSRINWKIIGALFAGNLFVFLYTVSNTGLLMTTFYLIATVYLMYRKKPSMVEYGLVQCVLPGCLLMSLVLPVLLQGRAFEILNKLMNTRIAQSRRYLTEEPLSLFGIQPGLNNAITTMDNSFLFAFKTYGIVIFIVAMLGYFLVIRKYVGLGKKKELAIMVTLLIAGISEPFLFNTSFKNLSLLFLGDVLFTGETVVAETESRTYGFLRKTKEWNVSYPVLGNLGGVARKYSFRLASAFLLAGVLSAACYGLTASLPETVAVPRELCDSVEQESFYIQPERTDASMKVYGYIDEKTEMVSFDGVLIQAEFVRSLVSRGIYAGGIGFIVVFALCSMLEYNNSSRIRSSSDEKRRKTK